MRRKQDSKPSETMTLIYFVIIVIALLALIWNTTPSEAATETDIGPRSEESTQSLVPSRFRIRTFSEIMTPALQGNNASVPYPDETEYTPTNAFSIFWIDYELSSGFKLLYWQRMIINFSENSSFQSNQVYPRDPRLGLRKTSVYSVPNLESTYDFYFQPGVTSNSYSSKNDYEIGFRTNHAYAIPRSRWNLGLITEFTSSYLNPSGKGNRVYGWVMTWGSYDLNQTLATQHVITVPYKNLRSNSWLNFTLDDPNMPFIQNGISMSISKVIWTSIFLNNYLFTKPTLKNTWASLWVTLTLL